MTNAARTSIPDRRTRGSPALCGRLTGCRRFIPLISADPLF